MNTLISVKYRNCFVLASLLSIFSQLAQAEEERLVYHDKPMQLKLPVNIEVRVKFPQDVSLQVKEELLPKLKPLLPDAKPFIGRQLKVSYVAYYCNREQWIQGLCV